MIEPNKHLYIERARLLLKQKRYKDAEAEAALVLQHNPNDVDALQIIGHCRLDNRQTDEAIRLFQQCIGIDASDDYLYYLLAFAWYQKNKMDKSLHFLLQAISLFPYHAGYFSLQANIYITQKKYQLALEAANKGLSINAKDVSCLNARSKAQLRLNHKEAAFSTMQEALQLDPEDAHTHINYGWAFLEKNKHKEALQHFREALRLNPNSQYAKNGLKTALKCNLPFYRWLLQYQLWISQQSRFLRFGFILGIWFIVQLTVGNDEAGHTSISSMVIIGVYLLLVLFSWLGNTLANLYLLCSRYGRYVLDTGEKWSALLVAASFIVASVFCVSGLLYNEQLLWNAAITASFSIIFNVLPMPLQPFRGGKKAVLLQLLLLTGMLAIAATWINEDMAMVLRTIYLLALVACMWAGSLLSA